MRKALLPVVVFSLAVTVTSGARAQVAEPIVGADVIGRWKLAISPNERDESEVSVRSNNGGQPDLSLSISPGQAGHLSCMVQTRDAECQIEGEKLIVKSPSRSGGAMMMITIVDRTDLGFSGYARVDLGEVGGEMPIGTVNMTRDAGN